MSGSLLFVALCLASYRTWRFVAKDDITQPVRALVFINKTKQARFGSLDSLVDCEWCLGTWLSLAAVYATHRWLVPLDPHWLLWAVAVSCVVGFFGKLDDHDAPT